MSSGTCLAVQQLRIQLLVQRTEVLSLVREDPTCCRAAEPMSHNYWVCTPEPTPHNKRNCGNEKSEHHNQRVEPARCN